MPHPDLLPPRFRDRRIVTAFKAIEQRHGQGRTLVGRQSESFVENVVYVGIHVEKSSTQSWPGHCLLRADAQPCNAPDLAQKAAQGRVLDVKSETAMILEVAILHVRAGESGAFEQAFSQAQDIISSMPGYASHQLQRCLELQDKYLLLVQWQRLEDHTIGFRQSLQYQEWKQLLHHFY